MAAPTSQQEVLALTDDVPLTMSTLARIRSAHRIHIIGSPGAGKSTLAQRLSTELGLPVFHLDLIAYEGPEFTERPLAFRSARVTEITSLTGWITEGIFIGWTQPLLDEAELIIWLDYLRWRRAAARITLRTFRTALREVTLRRGTQRFFRFRDYRRNFRQLLLVLNASREYWAGGSRNPFSYPATREELDLVLREYAGKVIHITERRDAQMLAELLKPRISG